ncbi:MAG: B12-binding domain-containing radical SAM protein [Candidatus Hodarchaeales archaeon]
MKDERIARKYSISISQYELQTSNTEIISGLTGKIVDLYGFTTYVWNIDKVLEIARCLKAANPRTTIVLGGPEASGMAEKVLKRYNFVDFVIKGEGELAFRSFLTSNSFVSVPGLVYRNSGTIVSNPEILLKDLDDLVLPHENKEYRDYLDSSNTPIRAAIETSRGCPFSCAYCTWGKRRMRYFSLEKLKPAFKYLFNHPNVATIYITDSNPFLRKKRSNELLNFIIENNIFKKPVTFEVSPEYMTDEGIVDLIAQLHHEEFAFGVQSTSQNVLKQINRKFDANLYRKNINKIRQMNSEVEFWFSLIIGLPGDNYSQFVESVDFVLNLNPEGIYFHELLCLPGSDIYNDPDKYGIEFMEEAPHKVLKNATFPLEEYNRAKKLAYHIYLMHRTGLRDELYELNKKQKRNSRLVDSYLEFNEFLDGKLDTLAGNQIENVTSWFFEQKANEFIKDTQNIERLNQFYCFFKEELSA